MDLRQDSLRLWGHRVARSCRGIEVRTKATDNHHHLRCEAKHSEPLLTEKLPEFGHIRKGSGPANWWSLPRPFLFQSIHKGGFTDIPTRDFQGLCGLGVQANTADILCYCSSQPNSNIRVASGLSLWCAGQNVLGFAGVTTNIKIPGTEEKGKGLSLFHANKPASSRLGDPGCGGAPASGMLLVAMAGQGTR